MVEPQPFALAPLGGVSTLARTCPTTSYPRCPGAEALADEELRWVETNAIRVLPPE